MSKHCLIVGAGHAAATICGRREPYAAVPWFWSDQFDLKLKIAGLSQGFDDVIIRGSTDEGRSFAAFYLRKGKLIAVDAVNKTKEFTQAKGIIAGQLAIDTSALADENIQVKELVLETQD